MNSGAISISDAPAIDGPNELLDAFLGQVVDMGFSDHLDQRPKPVTFMDGAAGAAHAAASQLKRPLPWFTPPHAHSQFIVRPEAFMQRASHSWREGLDL